MGEADEEEPAEPIDLQAVAREILADLMVQRGLSGNKAAKAFGLTQRAFNHMAHGRGGTLRTLSSVCSHLRMTPMEFFRLHKSYAPGESERRLLELLEEARKIGAQDAAVATLSAMLSIAKSSESRGNQTDPET